MQTFLDKYSSEQPTDSSDSQTIFDKYLNTDTSSQDNSLDTKQTFLDKYLQPQDISNAKQDLGDQSFAGWCESFAEKMAGKPNMGKSASEAWDNFVSQGKAQTDLGNIQPGNLIYFAPDESNQGDGHVGIYEGDNKFISATYAGVQEWDLNDWQKQTGQQILGYVH